MAHFLPRLSWKTIICLLILAGVLFLKLIFSLHGLPGTNCDEVAYIEPAVNFAKTGHFGSPGLAEQLALKGVHGLAQTSFIVTPMGPYCRIAGYVLLGTDFQGRRMVDWLVFTFALGTFIFAARAWERGPLVLLVAAIMGLSPTVMWNAGRSDVFSMGFGLIAFGLAARLIKRDTMLIHRKIGVAYLVGLFAGFSGLAHPFGGVFWGVTAAVFVLTHNAGQARWRELIFLSLAIGLGGFSSLAIWLPRILAAPELWYEQFYYLAALKVHLAKDFTGTALAVFYDLRKYHVVFVAVVASLFLPWRDPFQRFSRNAILIALILLLIWRCRCWEFYAGPYIVHFWGLLCIWFVLACKEWAACLQRYVTSNLWGLFLCLFFGGVLLEMSAVCYVGLIATSRGVTSSFSLPVSKAVIAALNRRIGPDDKVLACATCYLDLNTTNKTFWYWGETLNLDSYDVIISRYPKIITLDKGEWVDFFTSQQAAEFHRQFELSAVLPPTPVRIKFFPEAWALQTQPFYIFKKNHPSAKAGENPRPPLP